MKPETKFVKSKVTPLLKGLPKSWFFTVQLVSIRGIPDIVGLVNGYFVALEAKVGLNDASPLQKHNIKLIREAGGFACVIDDTNYLQVVEALYCLTRDGNPRKLCQKF